MSILTNPELINFLACPNCGNDLIETRYQLECQSCEEEYEIRHGIPILYHTGIDIEHLREEENLAKMMKRERTTKKDKFSSSQWELSKEEFLGMVKHKIEPPPPSLSSTSAVVTIRTLANLSNRATLLSISTLYMICFIPCNETTRQNHA